MQKRPRIVVEGPDGAGKTSLIKAWIKAGYYCILTRQACPPVDARLIFAYMEWVGSCPQELPLVCDRHPCIGEHIYGPILRGRDLLAGFPPGWGLLGHVNVVVYCRPPLETIVTNVLSTVSDHLPQVDEKIRAIVDAYDDFLLEINDYGVPVVCYDYLRHSPSAIWERITS